MKTVCEPSVCTACKACAEICPKHAITCEDLTKNSRAVIDEASCISCGLCEKVCQAIKRVELKKPIAWFQGWAEAQDERAKSSSGGFAYTISKQMIEEGGIVVSCCMEKGRFVYAAAETAAQLEQFRGSKYVKSDPAGAYRTIRELLQKDKRVLFIGLPCHAAALKLYLGNLCNDNLIVADLICHGSPSMKLLDLFLKQYGYSMDSFTDLSFRQKGRFSLSAIGSDGKKISFTQPQVRDRYSMGFLKGLFYTDNCYHCAYARTERVSDLTLGDSWGSELSAEQRMKGISLVLCQSEKGMALLKRSPLDLAEVDLDKAVAANHQLREPSREPSERKIFFDQIERGKSFNHAVGKSFPKLCFRQDVKNLLSKLHLVR